MSKRKIIDGTEIHEGSGNVYRNLGYPDADEMLVKAQLVSKISEIIRSQELTQVEAARILGVTQLKLSGLLRGQFRGISGQSTPCNALLPHSTARKATERPVRIRPTLPSGYTEHGC